MSTIRWRGDAPAVAQITTITLTGTCAAGDELSATINGKSVTATATTTSLTTLASLMVTAWNASDIAEFEEVTASSSGAVITLTADTAGKPFTVSFAGVGEGQIGIVETTPGTDGTDEVQSFYFATTPTGGVFTITYDGQTTSPLLYDATASEVQAALVALSNIGSGDVTVTGSGTSANPFILTFAGALAATNLSEITVTASSLTGGNTITIATVRDGSATSVAMPLFSIIVSGSTFSFYVRDTLGTGDSYLVGPLNWNDSAATVEAAIEAASAFFLFGGVTVTGGRGQTSNTAAFFVRFDGFAGSDVVASTFIAASNCTCGRVAKGTGTAYEYEVVNAGSATAGTFTLSDGVDTTSAIAFNATGSTIATEVETDIASIASGEYAYVTGVLGVTLHRRTASNLTALTIGTGSLTGTATVETGRNGGGAAVSEIQKVYHDGTGGDFTLTYSGQTTSAIAYNATSSELEDALEALSNIGASDLTITGSGTEADPYFITFGGSLANTNLTQMTGSSASLTGAVSATISTTTAGSGPTDEVQTITITGASSGTFTLSYEGATTAAIAYNATAYAVRDALCDLSTIAGTDEVQTLTITGTPTGGTFTMTYSGQTTAGIAYNANAATVQAALEALSNIGAGDVVCTGGDLPGTPVVVTFRQALGRTNVALMTADGASLTGGTTPAAAVALTTAGVDAEVTVSGSAGGPYTVTFVNGLGDTDVDLLTADNDALVGTTSITATAATPTASEGPNHVNLATNYVGGALPTTGDTLVIQDTDVDLLYGLDALTSVTLVELRIDASFTGEVGLPDYDADGDYFQYRGKYLELGSTLVTIGSGEGSGSGRLKLNLKAVQSTVNVLSTGQPAEQGRRALILKGTHASNALNVISGSVDVAPDAGEASTFATVRVSYAENQTSDSLVRFGDNVTLTNLTINGGEVTIASNTTSIMAYEGEVTIAEGAHASISIYGGELVYNSSGTLTTLLVSNALADFGKDPRPKVVTNAIDAYRGATIADPLGVLIAGGFEVNDHTGDVKVIYPPGYTGSIA